MRSHFIRLVFFWSLCSCSGASFKSYASSQGAATEADADAAAAEDGGIKTVGEGDSIGGQSGGEGDSTAAPTDQAPTAPSPDDVTKIKDLCKTMSDKVQRMSQTLAYPKRKSCSFDTAPNLAPRDKYVQAREISPATLNLPEGVVCGLAISSEAKTHMQYDDFLVLSLSDHVVFLTNGLLTDYLAKENEVFLWDFTKVVGKPIKDFEAGRYCIGKAADCVLPPHDKKGPVSIKLTNEEIAPISAVLEGKKSAAMDLVALGDNDASDCSHTDLSLTVEISFVPR